MTPNEFRGWLSKRREIWIRGIKSKAIFSNDTPLDEMRMMAAYLRELDDIEAYVQPLLIRAERLEVALDRVCAQQSLAECQKVARGALKGE